MLENTVPSVPQFRLFMLNALPQKPQNVTVVPGSNSLTPGDKFTVHIPASQSVRKLQMCTVPFATKAFVTSMLKMIK